MSNCSGNCGNCASASEGGCGSTIEKFKTNDNNRIKRVIGIVSGKGGVGKSLTTSALAVAMSKRGYSTGIIDGDITGASIPRIFGVKSGIMGDGKIMYPAVTRGGIKLISINLMLEQEDSPVIWRGSMLQNCLKQFWQDVMWEDIDYMFVDMPPGTGDVPLTAFQSLPLDGIIIVTSPQDMVAMIVRKAYKMAVMMNVPVIGIIENFSYMQCPDCGKKLYPFGEGQADKVASDMNCKMLARLPINTEFASACDTGMIEDIELGEYPAAADGVEAFFNK